MWKKPMGVRLKRCRLGLSHYMFGRRDRGAAMTHLSPKASFHSREDTTPSNSKTKYLGLGDKSL